MSVVAPLVDIVNGTSFIAMRSIASKLVPPEELGKLNGNFIDFGKNNPRNLPHIILGTKKDTSVLT